MKNYLHILLVLVYTHFAFGQIEKNIHSLNALDDLLTEEVKSIIDQNIAETPTVFLGEAVHFSGSDFLAKAEVVKYLVEKHGYKNIAFESDFFGLFFQHDKHNLYKMWGYSKQCADLMVFLKSNNVTLWGFDNKLHSAFSQRYFVEKLRLMLKGYNVEERFFTLTETIVKNEYNSRGLLSKDDIQYLKNTVSELLDKPTISGDNLSNQILENYYSAIELYTIKDGNDDKERIRIRDRQMAKNLDFLVRQNPNEKFIVWLANGHMSKCDYDKMNGQTMGAQFIALNPNSSYHIAFGSIKMPPEKKDTEINRAARNANNILHYITSVKENYFMDAKKIRVDSPEFAKRIYNDAWIFNMYSNKTDILNHYDALIFIAGGIEVTY